MGVVVVVFVLFFLILKESMYMPNIIDIIKKHIIRIYV